MDKAASPVPNRETWQINAPRDLIELVMTQHWDMAACPCTFCEAGRQFGFHAHEGFLDWRIQGYDQLRAVPSKGLAIAPWADLTERDITDCPV